MFANDVVPVVADFAGGVAPEGWTVVNGDGNGEYSSPTYSAAVDRIELRYDAAGAGGAAAVYASSNSVESQIATFSAASTAASFDFPETTSFDSFRITTANGLSLSSFAAYVSQSEMDPPAGVVISNNTTGTSFDASWNPVAGATGYKVYVWTNAVAGASAGSVVWQETMPGATNAFSSTKLTDAKFTACFEKSGWTRSGQSGYPTGEDGTIRIGTSGDNGWLQTPQIDFAVDGMAVRFYAKANASNAKSMQMAVERVSNEAANIVGTAALTTEMQEFTIAFPEWAIGDSIRFNSLTNGDRRTIIGYVAIVSGYSEGRKEPSYIVDGRDVGGVTSFQFAGLPSVPVFFAVEAYGKRGATSSMSEAVEVDLSNPDKVAVLNACPISSLVGIRYTQDFDSLADLTSTTGDKEWLNGTTLPYWQAYNGNAAVESFKYNGGYGNTGGLYALATNQSHQVRALGAYSSQNGEYSFGIAFTNDTDMTVTLSSVAYSAQQWGFKNTTNQTLSVSAQVVNSLEGMAAFDDGWTTLAETQSAVYGEGSAYETPEASRVSVNTESEIRIAPGQVLMLKWTVHSLKSGKPGMMAIDDVAVSFASPKTGLSIRLANVGSRP